MARQNAKDFLIKVEDSEGAGTFSTLGMLRSTDYTLTPGQEEVTNKDSGDYTERETTRLTFSASGRAFFDAGAPWARLTAAVRGLERPKLQVVVPGEGTYEGRFIVEVGASGEEQGSVECNCSLTNAGDLTFT